MENPRFETGVSMMRHTTTAFCLLLPLLTVGGRTVSADDFEFNDPEAALEFKLREIGDSRENPLKNRSPSGRRAIAILNAQRDAMRGDFVRRLEALGLQADPSQGELPSPERLQEIRALAAEAREKYKYSVELDLLNDYLNVIDNRLAAQFLGDIDIESPDAELTDSEIERLRALIQNDVYRSTNVADRVRAFFAERQAKAELEALDLELAPEVLAALDREARREFAIALRLVPSQRVPRLRELAEIYVGTSAAAGIDEEIERARAEAAATHARRRAENAAYEARARSLRAYWGPRYDRSYIHGW